MVGRREHDVTNLKRIHLVIAGHQDAHGTGNVRCSHGGTTPGSVARIAVVVRRARVDAIARSSNRPPLALTSFVEVLDEFVRTSLRTLLQTGNSNPVLFSGRVVERVESTVVRVLHVAVARRHDLNDVPVLDGFISGINERLVVHDAVSCSLIKAITLGEEHELVVRFSFGIHIEVNAGVVAVMALVLLINNTGVRTPGVVDHATAIAIGLGNLFSEVAPGCLEVFVILERTVVVVVRSTSVADDDVGTPGHAMEFAAVTIAANGTRHVRAVRVIDAFLPIAIDVEFFAFVEGIADSSFILINSLRIAVANGTVFALGAGNAETIARKVRMNVQECARVHDADGHVLAVKTKSVCLGGVHGRKAPVLLVF